MHTSNDYRAANSIRFCPHSLFRIKERFVTLQHRLVFSQDISPRFRPDFQSTLYFFRRPSALTWPDLRNFAPYPVGKSPFSPLFVLRVGTRFVPGCLPLHTFDCPIRGGSTPAFITDFSLPFLLFDPFSSMSLIDAFVFRRSVKSRRKISAVVATFGAAPIKGSRCTVVAFR